MSKLFDLSGKVALITGASSGLGVHFAHCLGAAGASIVLAARRADRLASLQAELTRKGVTARAVDLDVQSGKSIAAALDAAGPLDVVINNAGISIVKPALDMPEDDWDAVVDTNLRGAWLVAQGAARRWVADKRPGSIVNIASILGLRTIGQVAPYNASKAGLIHLTRALAMEWARHDIRVNAICPGYIETEMNGPSDRPHPATTHRPARTSRRCAAIARVRSRRFHDRQRDHRRWRPHGQLSLEGDRTVAWGLTPHEKFIACPQAELEVGIRLDEAHSFGPVSDFEYP